MKIVAVSDTHNRHNKLEIPECDILIHAGDWSFNGRESETRNFAKWLNKQEAGYIIVIAGNHEVDFERAWPESKSWITDECPAAIVLNNEMIEIEGIKIWGSPETPWFYNWAYNRRRTESEAMAFGGGWIKDTWDKIPEGMDIIVTHGPPHGINDELLLADGTPKGEFVGCYHLRDKLIELKPKLHLCGHIHCGYGYKREHDIDFYNVSVCGESYAVDNAPTVINFP